MFVGRFATTFALSDSSILEDVKRIMMPNARSVRAEPYKLHVYRPGDFFKPHVDTPRGAGQFGSLVVRPIPAPALPARLFMPTGSSELSIISQIQASDT